MSGRMLNGIRTKHDESASRTDVGALQKQDRSRFWKVLTVFFAVALILGLTLPTQGLAALSAFAEDPQPASVDGDAVADVPEEPGTEEPPVDPEPEAPDPGTDDGPDVPAGGNAATVPSTPEANGAITEVPPIVDGYALSEAMPIADDDDPPAGPESYPDGYYPLTSQTMQETTLEFLMPGTDNDWRQVVPKQENLPFNAQYRLSFKFQGWYKSNLNSYLKTWNELPEDQRPGTPTLYYTMGSEDDGNLLNWLESNGVSGTIKADGVPFLNSIARITYNQEKGRVELELTEEFQGWVLGTKVNIGSEGEEKWVDFTDPEIQSQFKNEYDLWNTSNRIDGDLFFTTTPDKKVLEDNGWTVDVPGFGLDTITFAPDSDARYGDPAISKVRGTDINAPTDNAPIPVKVSDPETGEDSIVYVLAYTIRVTANNTFAVPNVIVYDVISNPDYIDGYILSSEDSPNGMADYLPRITTVGIDPEPTAPSLSLGSTPSVNDLEGDLALEGDQEALIWTVGEMPPVSTVSGVPDPYYELTYYVRLSQQFIDEYIAGTASGVMPSLSNSATTTAQVPGSEQWGHDSDGSDYSPSSSATIEKSVLSPVEDVENVGNASLNNKGTGNFTYEIKVTAPNENSFPLVDLWVEDTLPQMYKMFESLVTKSRNEDPDYGYPADWRSPFQVKSSINGSDNGIYYIPFDDDNFIQVAEVDDDGNETGYSHSFRFRIAEMQPGEVLTIQFMIHVEDLYMINNGSIQEFVNKAGLQFDGVEFAKSTDSKVTFTKHETIGKIAGKQLDAEKMVTIGDGENVYYSPNMDTAPTPLSEHPDVDRTFTVNEKGIEYKAVLNENGGAWDLTSSLISDGFDNNTILEYVGYLVIDVYDASVMNGITWGGGNQTFDDQDGTLENTTDQAGEEYTEWLYGQLQGKTIEQRIIVPISGFDFSFLPSNLGIGQEGTIITLDYFAQLVPTMQDVGTTQINNDLAGIGNGWADEGEWDNTHTRPPGLYPWVDDKGNWSNKGEGGDIIYLPGSKVSVNRTIEGYVNTDFAKTGWYYSRVLDSDYNIDDPSNYDNGVVYYAIKVSGDIRSGKSHKVLQENGEPLLDKDGKEQFVDGYYIGDTPGDNVLMYQDSIVGVFEYTGDVDPLFPYQIEVKSPTTDDGNGSGSGSGSDTGTTKKTYEAAYMKQLLKNLVESDPATLNPLTGTTLGNASYVENDGENDFQYFIGENPNKDGNPLELQRLYFTDKYIDAREKAYKDAVDAAGSDEAASQVTRPDIYIIVRLSPAKEISEDQAGDNGMVSYGNNAIYGQGNTPVSKPAEVQVNPKSKITKNSSGVLTYLPDTVNEPDAVTPPDEEEPTEPEEPAPPASDPVNGAFTQVPASSKTNARADTWNGYLDDDRRTLLNQQGEGLYTMWNITVNYNGSMQGTPTSPLFIIDDMPSDQLEFVYAEITGMGDYYTKGIDVVYKDHTEAKKADAIPQSYQISGVSWPPSLEPGAAEWTLTSSLASMPIEGVDTAPKLYSYTNGSQIMWLFGGVSQAEGVLNPEDMGPSTENFSITLRVVCKVTDPNAYLNTHGQKIINNVGNFNPNLESIVDQASASTTVDNGLSKGIDNEALADYDGTTNNSSSVSSPENYLPFELDINPAAIDLSFTAPYMDILPPLHDEVGSPLVYIQDTVKVIDADTGTVLYASDGSGTMADSISVEFIDTNENGNPEMVISGLPDETHLTLRYATTFSNNFLDDDNNTMKDQSFSNGAWFEGYTAGYYSQISKWTYNYTAGGNSLAQGGNMLRLTKVDADNGAKVLPDAEYELFTYGHYETYRGSGQWIVGNPIQVMNFGDDKFFTDADGNLDFTGLASVFYRVYKLVEVEAPEGYDVESGYWENDPFYFAFVEPDDITGADFDVDEFIDMIKELYSDQKGIENIMLFSNPDPTDQDFAMTASNEKIPDDQTGKTRLSLVKKHRNVTTDPNGAFQTENVGVNEGDILEYQLMVNNLTDVIARNVTITDQVPEGLTIVQESLKPATIGGVESGTVSYDASSRTITWSGFDLAKGTPAIATFQVVIPALDENTSFSNIAHVKADNAEDPGTENTVTAKPASDGKGMASTGDITDLVPLILLLITAGAALLYIVRRKQHAMASLRKVR